MVPVNVSPPHAADFLYDILCTGCNQINILKNDFGKLLDLVFTNEFLCVEINTPAPLSKVDPYHSPLLLNFETQIHQTDSTQINCPNFNRGNYTGLCNYLNNLNITTNLIHQTLDEKIAYLHDVLSEGIRQFIPPIKKRRFINAWWNVRLQKLKNKRNKEWKRYKLIGSDQIFIEHLLSLIL
jgi:hypothetical protein